MRPVELSYLDSPLAVPQYPRGAGLLQGGEVWAVKVAGATIKRPGLGKCKTFTASMPDDRARRVLEAHALRYQPARMRNCDSHAYTYFVMGWLKKLEDLHSTREPGATVKPNKLEPGEPYGIFRDDIHLYSVVGLGGEYSLSTPGGDYKLMLAGNGLLLAATGGNRFAKISK